jgi:hypothetical protein
MKRYLFAAYDYLTSGELDTFVIWTGFAVVTLLALPYPHGWTVPLIIVGIRLIGLLPLRKGRK